MHHFKTKIPSATCLSAATLSLPSPNEIPSYGHEFIIGLQKLQPEINFSTGNGK